MIRYAPPDASIAPRFSGIKTFMKLPHITEMKDVDFAIVGIPFDTGVVYKTGARFAPAQIRDASTILRNYSMNLDVNIFHYLSGVDYGDIPVIPGYIHETYKKIEEGLIPILEAGVVPISMGGDHSITLGELRAVCKVHGPIPIVHFDAHLDTWDNFWGVKYTHGTPLRRACEEGLIDTSHSIQIGIRGTQSGPSDVQGSVDLGFEVITANEMHKIGMEAVGERIRNRVKDKAAFLTFDVDFVDPASAPGTGTFEVEGFTGHETMSLIREIKDIKFVAADFVEVLPTIDPAGITSHLVASIMHEFIATLALQKSKNQKG